MNNNFDKNIQELLNSHTEQPSANCWSRISSQLDAFQMPDSNAGSSGNAAHFSQFIGSVAGKIVSAVIAAAAIGGIIVWAVVNSPENKVKTEEKSTILSDNIQSERSIFNEEKTQHTNANAASFEKDKNTASESGIYYPVGQDTNNIVETKTIQTLNTVQNMVETSTTQLETENTTKTENKAQPTTKEPKKRGFINSGEDNPAENATENEVSQEQKTTEVPQFIIPNFLAANGHFFIIEDIEQFSENQLYIYDRYQNIVYEKTNYQNNWGAENLTDGVYYYIFKYVYHGSQFMRSGSLTIKR